jgi:hypothetical protein
MHNIDETLADLGVGVSAATRAREWLLPINPLAYGRLSANIRWNGAGTAFAEATAHSRWSMFTTATPRASRFGWGLPGPA